MQKSILLFNTDLEAGGAERQLVHVARNLDRSRWDLNLLLLEGTGPFLEDIPDDVTVYTLSKGYPKNKAARVFWGMLQLLAVRRFFREKSFDLVLTFLWLPTALCAVSLARSGRSSKLVWSVQVDLESALPLYKRAPAKKVIRRAVDHYICTSKGVGENIRADLSVPRNKISVIHNAIDSHSIAKDAEEKAPRPGARKSLQMVSMGRLHPAKGYPDLVEAIAKIATHLPDDFELVIMGDGPSRQNIEYLIQKFCLEGRIKLAGFVRNPYAQLKTADMFIMPSRWETFGIALAEAMVLGLPSVVTATSGARDIIEPGVQGLMVPVGDVESLSKAILKLAQSDALRREMGRKARQRAQQFDVSAIVNQYEDVLSRVSV